MLLDDIADYLSSGGLGTVNTDIFMGGFPDEAPDAAIAIYETGGVSSVHAMNSAPGRAVIERPRVQVIARGAERDYQSARLRVNGAVLLLDGMRERSINGTRYLWAAAVQSPYPVGHDDNRRPRVAVNFDVMKVLSTS